jgi:protein TonB
LWRKVCLISGVLAGHVALLGWLQLAPHHDGVVAPALRFQLAPTAPPLWPAAPVPSASPTPPVSSKVKKSSLVAAQKQTETARPTASDAPVSTPATNLTTGLGITDKIGEVANARSAHTGVATLAQATPATPVTVLPSSNADYLNNPAPAYPAISRRLGEQGKVVIRVLIDKDGKPQQGEIGQSSGYTRLDQAALHAVMAWRYVPGRRDGTAQDMWFNVPIHFALQ